MCASSRCCCGSPRRIPGAASLYPIQFVPIWAVSPCALLSLCGLCLMFRKLGAPWALLRSRRGPFLWRQRAPVPRAPLLSPSGLFAASQAADVECVALVLAWAVWSASQAAQDTCIDEAGAAHHCLGTLPECEGRKWRHARAAVVTQAKDAIARMRSRHPVRTRALLSLSRWSVTSDETTQTCPRRVQNDTLNTHARHKKCPQHVLARRQETQENRRNAQMKNLPLLCVWVC